MLVFFFISLKFDGCGNRTTTELVVLCRSIVLEKKTPGMFPPNH
jgi:hypothetical protein